MSQRQQLLDGADLLRDKVRRESSITRSTARHRELAAAFALPVWAQDALPRPEQTFKGHIGRTVEESTKDFPRRLRRPRVPRISCSSSRTMLASAQAVRLWKIQAGTQAPRATSHAQR